MKSDTPMSNETTLRDHLVKLLTSAWAHVTPEDGIAGVPPDQRGVRLPGHPHTIWQLLEHLRICQDDLTLVFMDNHPVARGHSLIITREHFENLYEVSDEALAAVASASRRLAPAIRQVIAPDGLRVFQLNGAAAGQTVFHYHMHLIPRTTAEPERFPKRVPANDAELDAVAAEFAAALGSSPGV